MSLRGSHKSRTRHQYGASRNWWALLACLLVLPAASIDPGTAPWPPFLAGRDSLPADVAVGVEHVWTNVTLSRRVRGPTAHVTFDVFTAFLDAPDVTTAAARFRRLANYEAHALDEDWYWADDHDGARGIYRVIVRTPTRRVMLSWGEHTGRIGHITGSALTVIQLEPRETAVDQTLSAYVFIDNRVAAALAQFLAPVFGHLADRKLAKGLAVTAQIAEWATEHPEEFCPWLADGPVPPERREHVLMVVPACRDLTRSPPRGGPRPAPGRSGHPS